MTLARLLALGLLTATTALAAPDGAAPANATNQPAKALALVRVSSSKLRYRPKEAGTVAATVRNLTPAAQKATLQLRLIQELSRERALPPVEIDVDAGVEKTVNLPFTAGETRYGCEARVTLMKGATVFDSASDFFAVHESVWPVAIGAGDVGLASSSGYPWQNPRADITKVRSHYWNWWEKDFWGPDDFGDLSPEADRWRSGEGGRLEIRKVIHEFVGLARSNGVASITYGKSTAGGPAGWDLARRHPDWFNNDASGRPVGTFNTAFFPLSKWNAMPGDPGGLQQWFYLYPNLNRVEALDWGIDTIIRSAQEYGWDGVRFDGDFTWVSSDEVAARNQRRMKERIWQRFPDFVFGYNQGHGPPATDPATWPHGMRESVAGGGHWMNEGIRGWAFATNGRYTSLAEYWRQMNREADTLRRLGATYHLILDAHNNTQGLYKFILATQAGAHSCYGDSAVVPGCANWGRFLTRWSALIWDVNLRNRPEADAEMQSATPLWTSVKERVVDATCAMTVVHLVVPPSSDIIDDAMLRIGPEARQVTLRVRIPSNEQCLCAAVIAPEHPEAAIDLPTKRDGDWVSVTVPDVRLWTMVAFEHRGHFDLPAYPKFSAAPDPMKVKAQADAMPGELIRDPLKPDDKSERASRVRVIEAESTYLSNGQRETDPDASNGGCVRVDETVQNSTILSHAFFNNVQPGRYRVTYRVKEQSRTNAAGQKVWAGFACYVQMGSKSLALREITPEDYKTPGQYEDCSGEFDYLGEGSMIQPTLFWRGHDGHGTAYIDKVTLEELHPYTDASLADKLKIPAASGVLLGRRDGLHVLVLNGLYYDLYRIADAVRKLGALPEASARGEIRLDEATVNVGESGVFSLAGYPKTFEALSQYDVVVLINANAAWLQFAGRAQLRDFVQAGGGLLVLGGNFSLGQGQFAGTFLADLLPVSVAATADVEPSAKPLPLTPGGPLAGSLPPGLWKQRPSLYWRHIVQPKPDAQVHVLAGKEPVLLSSTFGKGRVAVFTGTVLGDPPGTSQPFWQWDGWNKLMQNTITWLARE